MVSSVTTFMSVQTPSLNQFYKVGIGLHKEAKTCIRCRFYIVPRFDNLSMRSQSFFF